MAEQQAEHLASIDDLAAEEPSIVTVSMDDKGAVYYIGDLSSDEFVEWNAAKESGSAEDRRNAAAKLIVRSLVKGKNDPTRIGTLDMVPKFRKIRVAKSERLLKAIFKLNNINQKDEVEVKNG